MKLKLIKGFQKLTVGKSVADAYNTLIGQLDSNFRQIEKIDVSSPACGIVKLVGGQKIVKDSRVTNDMVILLTRQKDGSVVGTEVRVSQRVVGESFTIDSNSGTDDCYIGWVMFKTDNNTNLP